MTTRRSARITRLRQAILESVPTVGIERGQLVTEAYQQSEAHSILIKRARALERVLTRMTLFINADDLLVGSQGHALRCPPIYPENFVDWMDDPAEMDRMESRQVNPLRIPAEIRPQLREMARYWKGRTLVDRCYAAFPADVTRARRALLFSVSLEKNAVGHCVLDYPKLLRLGYLGIKEEALTRLRALDLSDPQDLGKRDFLEAAVITCDAIVAFAARYAKLAEQLAARASDPEDKQRLLTLAAICKRVPAQPATTFHEATQAVWFAHVVNYLETNAYSMSFGRFDQYMLPYYEEDLRAGTLAQDHAQEIINCLWCKSNEILHVDDSEMVYFHGGHPMGQHLTVGGVTRDGEDAVNALSYMCLAAHELVELPQPDFSVRLHRHSPRAFKRRAAEVIRKGLGLPQLFNDEVIMAALTHDGLPLEDARDYSPTGCVENSTPQSWIRAPGGWLNVPKILELTLHQGKCALSGEQIGPPGQPVEEISTFSAFMECFAEQFAAAVRLHVIWSNLIDGVHAEVMPQPSVSLLIDDCLAKGTDAVQGGARYNFTSPLLVGIANVADSLAAIQHLVYDTKEITLAELTTALDADFVGHELLRARLLHAPPKYGNDVDAVDDLAARVSRMFCDEFARYRNTRGGGFRAGFWSVTANFGLGLNTAATPDGRRRGEPLSDSITPGAGMDVNGLTASLKSAAKLAQDRASNGTVLNRHIMPAELEGDEKIGKFVDLVDGYFELGGSNLGFNIVSAEMLQEAKAHPEQHADLMVKVAGYAALFVELGTATQDELISRTQHGLS